MDAAVGVRRADAPVEVEYRGRTYRRYPDAPRRSAVVYYYPTGPGAGEAEPLHRQVWIDQHGPIPDGWDVHHQDEDPFNNDPGNLQALPRGEHRRVHSGTWDDTDAMAEHLASIRPLAAEGHRTDESRARKSANARRQWVDVPAREWICEECGGRFESRSPFPPRHCSQRCRNRVAERDGGQRTFVCEGCGGEFTGRWRPSRPRRFCGVACRNRAIAAGPRRCVESGG